MGETTWEPGDAESCDGRGDECDAIVGLEAAIKSTALRHGPLAIAMSSGVSSRPPPQERQGVRMSRLIEGSSSPWH